MTASATFAASSSRSFHDCNAREQRNSTNKRTWFSTAGDSSVQMDTISDGEALRAMERLEELDAKLRVNSGVTKERAKLHQVVAHWEQRQATDTVCELDDDDLENFEAGNDNHDDKEDNTVAPRINVHAKYVMKHAPHERVALFGGDPAKRRHLMAKRLAPYAVLDQFGSPHDVGHGDQRKLLQKIASQSYDVVYIWTRFNCHSSRNRILRAVAAQSNKTRVAEVESLAYIVGNDERPPSSDDAYDEGIQE
ncbi:hypothetical protein ACA910_018776 [Epithemia clementina (nom. ined.)]